MRAMSNPSWRSGLVLLVLAGCGAETDDEAPRTGGGAGTSPAATEEPAARTIDPSTVGRVHGVVRVEGEVPPPEPLTILGEAWCVQVHQEDPITDQRLVVHGGALEDAFVWIRDGLQGYAFEAPEEPAVLDQEGCRYVPHVLGVMTGQTLLAKNSDPVMHNVHAKPDRNKARNFGIPVGGSPRPLSFRREEVMVEVICDVHAWMRSWVGVVDHPFFAVTGADGRFAIDGLPPGDYVLGVWQEELGTLEVPFTLEARGDVELAPSYSP